MASLSLVDRSKYFSLYFWFGEPFWYNMNLIYVLTESIWLPNTKCKEVRIEDTGGPENSDSKYLGQI